MGEKRRGDSVNRTLSVRSPCRCTYTLTHTHRHTRTNHTRVEVAPQTDKRRTALTDDGARQRDANGSHITHYYSGPSVILTRSSTCRADTATLRDDKLRVTRQSLDDRRCEIAAVDYCGGATAIILLLPCVLVLLCACVRVFFFRNAMCVRVE